MAYGIVPALLRFRFRIRSRVVRVSRFLVERLGVFDGGGHQAWPTKRMMLETIKRRIFQSSKVAMKPLKHVKAPKIPCRGLNPKPRTLNPKPVNPKP